MRSLPVLIAVMLTALYFNTSAQKLADPILLWPQGAPGATGTSDEDKPAVIPFIPDAAKRNGAAVLVVPGGGFTIRAVDHEGVLVAQWLKEHGITAFLLRYRLRPLYNRPEWLADGQRGMQFIRAHAAEYSISPNRVGAVGFSAGATLIADLTLNAKPAQANATDPLERLSGKPDFLILAYGSTRVADGADLTTMPPTFMYGTVEDKGSQTGMLDMYTRLYKGGAPVEAHFFRNGIHGTGFALGDPVLGEWTTLLYNWLLEGGYLTAKPQVELAGVVKLDGSPLLKGMVILTPVHDKNAPPVIIYMNNTGTGELGRFLVAKNQGPVEGRYKVEVRQDATRWTSNSREPFMIAMMDKQSKGTLTDADRKEWGEYIRKRNLSPSIYKQRVFARKHPRDRSNYIIDIKSGKDVLIEVFSK
ncbi:alpha/beta hydrolase [Mucilaginibacter auburnensis]|uniref:Alpha/beta hydrolase family protein n=1 Tax=Mucilaginibacter auburnensis TaxID=1457233 RepID=A0A2H9VM08_9SPHI|nr:alpha/beta hydrolase [Mucilaginibacter auburnensis]PJJ79364.1 alpha/beta hydrolase family protein [Mucilaginibacter auburnensis]